MTAPISSHEHYALSSRSLQNYCPACLDKGLESCDGGGAGYRFVLSQRVAG